MILKNINNIIILCFWSAVNFLFLKYLIYLFILFLKYLLFLIFLFFILFFWNIFVWINVEMFFVFGARLIFYLSFRFVGGKEMWVITGFFLILIFLILFFKNFDSTDMGSNPIRTFFYFLIFYKFLFIFCFKINTIVLFIFWLKIIFTKFKCFKIFDFV